VTKTKKVLNFICRSKNGRTFGEIQRFVVEMNGYNYDEFAKVNHYNRKTGALTKRRVRVHRGYWCDRFCDRHVWKITSKDGIPRSDIRRVPGLLSRNCVKYNGRYFIKANA